MNNLHGKEVLDLEVQLQVIVKILYWQSYHKARLRQLQVGFIDNKSNLIFFFKY